LQAAEIKAGMDIFGIPQPPYKELASIEHILELLDSLWGLVAEWESLYSSWKDGQFKDLQVCCHDSKCMVCLAQLQST
jgi:dynein heavy chain